MANANTPIGLKPVRTNTAAGWDGSANLYYIPSTDTHAYRIGDAVVSVAGGDTLTGAPAVTLAGTRNAAMTTGSLRGAIIGIGTAAGTAGMAVPLAADPNALGIVSIPATKTQNYFVWVTDDPGQVYEIQADSIASTAFNKNCPLFVANDPSVPTFNSASYAQGSQAATTQALPLKILGAPFRPDNDLTSPGTHARIFVMINQHELAGNTAGV